MLHENKVVLLLLSVCLFIYVCLFIFVCLFKFVSFILPNNVLIEL